MAKIKLNTPIYDLPSDVYHSTKNTYSSTQLKDMLEDEELFFKKYIEKSIPRESTSAFDIGTYFHTGVLEPHKLETECAVYPGAVKRGEQFEAFKARHPGKCILSPSDVDKAKMLIEAVGHSPVSSRYVKEGRPEVSMFVRLYVYDGEVFAFNKRWFTLNFSGWEPSIDMDASRMTSFVVKVRADVLGEGYILDLKSTTGNAKSEHTVKQKISAYKYDLSAALYLDIFTIGLGKKMNRFIWTFASKDFRNAKSWEASLDNVRIGRAKWRKAIITLAECIERNWSFDDCLGVVEPNYFEREYLKTEN